MADTRREAVPGAALTPVSEKGGEGWPGSGSSRGPIPGQWTVVAIANEGGDRGGGNPLPGQNDTRKFLSGTPPPPPRSLPRVFSVQTQFLQIAICR